MSDAEETVTKEQVRRVASRVGIPHDVLREFESSHTFPMRRAELLEYFGRRGYTTDSLTSRMGGSP